MTRFEAGTLAALAAVMMIPASAAAQARPAARQVTFTKDVAPILQRSCVKCHRDGQNAPMSLGTYEEVRPFARAVKSRVVNREMPPWHLDRNVGIQKFKDNPSLTDAEIATIAAWVDAGSPMGNKADMPPAPTFADGDEWAIGKPDLIVRFPAYTVPPTGPDLFPNLTASLGLTEDRYIKAIQTRPVNASSRRVLHHAITTMTPGEQPAAADGAAAPPADIESGSQFIVEYASGKQPEIYPEESGVLLKAGHQFRLGTHLHSVGEEIQAEVEIGMVLHPKGHVPKYIRYSTHHGDPRPDPSESLDIPAGEIARADGYTLHNKPGKIIAFQPHMHIRGKYQCLELIYPATSNVMRREMINCANWDYNWHMIYNYADDVAPLVPPGTIIHIISWHDNSPSRYNPDAKNWVGYGDRTIDDMGFAWIGWIDLTPEEYEAELAARNAKRRAEATSQQQQQ